jgi:GTP-binding protein
MSGFVDEAQLHAKAGDGGAGMVSFRREAHVDRGGPDGGDGGHGGDIWLVASHNEASLLGFRDHPHRRAVDGTHGAGKRKHGASGGDLHVPVPVGTVVKDRDGTVLVDLSGIGDRWLVAAGGRGGRGNARFLSNTRRAPAFAEQGERGEERWLDMELKLTADVAIVGMPNVGKSTLISAVSAAKPKIADYPFTTLEPHLGVVRVGGGKDEVEFVMADVPGLVEGAAEGRGLGHRFLRHVERARVLVLLVDLAAPDGRSPAEEERILLGELGRYRPQLLERPRVVVGSRADLVVADPAAGAEGPELSISAVTGRGVPALLGRLAGLVSAARAAEEVPDDGEIVIHRPLPEGVGVERVAPGVWAVTGRAATRAVGFSDLTDSGALDEAVRRLRKLGVDRALARAGARDGDEVRVGDVSFSWFRDATAGGLDAAGPDDPRPSAKRAGRGGGPAGAPTGGRAGRGRR